MMMSEKKVVRDFFLKKKKNFKKLLCTFPSKGDSLDEDMYEVRNCSLKK